MKEGTDVTIVTSGFMVHESMKAADKLEKEGISAEVIDLRTIAPIDIETIRKSVEKTHRAVVVQESQRVAGVGGNLMSEIGERCFMELDAPVARVTAPDSVYPFVQIENEWLPGPDAIVEQIKETINF